MPKIGASRLRTAPSTSPLRSVTKIDTRAGVDSGRRICARALLATSSALSMTARTSAALSAPAPVPARGAKRG